MGKPKIIGYKEAYSAPPGATLVGYTGPSELLYRKPMYAERQFHAVPAHGGYRVYCKNCMTTTLTGGCFPHDTASAHRCLYNPEEINDVAS